MHKNKNELYNHMRNPGNIMQYLSYTVIFTDCFLFSLH